MVNLAKITTLTNRREKSEDDNADEDDDGDDYDHDHYDDSEMHFISGDGKRQV